jgi:Mg-chelatase subunit ChlD
VADLLRQQSSRTTGRREMEQRHDNLEDVSPDVGQLDEQALAGLMGDDLDAGVSLLADMARATDPQLRARARAVAGRVLLPPVRVGHEARPGGSSRLVTVPDDGLDLDIDATLAQLAETPRLRAEDLRWRGWRRPARAYVLVVDASGSVSGKPLATAVITAAAMASRLRADDELAVLAFWSRAVVLRDLRSPDLPLAVLDALFDLRGGDTTDLAGGLRAGLGQAVLARASNREMVVLTDGMADEGNDYTGVAATAGAVGTRIHVLSLGGEADGAQSCARLAEAGGGRMAVLHRPSDAPGALAQVLRG